MTKKPILDIRVVQTMGWRLLDDGHMHKVPISYVMQVLREESEEFEDIPIITIDEEEGK